MESIPCPKCQKGTKLNTPDCEHCGADLSSLKTTIAASNLHFNRALEHFKQGLVDESIIEMQAALELWDKNPKFHNLLGKILAQKGLYSRAIIQWETALELDPNFRTAYQCIERAKRLEKFQSEIRVTRIPRALFWILGVFGFVMFILAIRLDNKTERLSAQLQQSFSEVKTLDRKVVELRAKQAAMAPLLIKPTSTVAAPAASKPITPAPAEPPPPPRVVGELRKKVSTLNQEMAKRGKQIQMLQQNLTKARIENASHELLVSDLRKSLSEVEQELAEQLLETSSEIVESTGVGERVQGETKELQARTEPEEQ